MNRRTATPEDFKVGQRMFDKQEGWSFVIQEWYAPRIWNARMERGAAVVFECEAQFYEVEIK